MQKGRGQPSQSLSKVVKPESMDGVISGPFQQTKRDVPAKAQLDTMEDAKNNPLHASKRKSQDDLECKATKKPKMGPCTMPPANTFKQARTTSFFVRNQKPGHTAAIPTVGTASIPYAVFC